METTTSYEFQSGIESEFSTELHRDIISGYTSHLHRNFEILIAEKGSAVCFIDGNEYKLNEGEAVFICPLQLHSFRPSDGGAVRRLTFCENIVLTLSNAIKQKKALHPVFIPEKADCEYFLGEVMRLFGESEFSSQRITPAAKRIKVKGLLYIIESGFLSQATLVPYTESKNAVIDVVRYISQNYRSDISLRDVAKEIGYNYQYLSREFNRTLKVSFKTILNQYRMNHAFVSLQDTDLPISRIAYDSGFKSIRSFNLVCLEIFGKTPTEVRRYYMKI